MAQNVAKSVESNGISVVIPQSIRVPVGAGVVVSVNLQGVPKDRVEALVNSWIVFGIRQNTTDSWSAKQPATVEDRERMAREHIAKVISGTWEYSADSATNGTRLTDPREAYAKRMAVAVLSRSIKAGNVTLDGKKVTKASDSATMAILVEKLRTNNPSQWDAWRAEYREAGVMELTF